MNKNASGKWASFLERAIRRVNSETSIDVSGTLTRLTGLVLEASGLVVPVGSQCLISMKFQAPVLAEVVGFSKDKAFLMPAGEVLGLESGASVSPTLAQISIPKLNDEVAQDVISSYGALLLPMGPGLLGRVVDAQGQPIDKKGPLTEIQILPLERRQINAMERSPVREVLDTGVRAINSLLTIGRGQRIGLFAGSGVGKSVLLGMMARYTKADVIVVGLIGERGREVKEFIEEILGDEGRLRSVVVAAPADAPPLLRMQGAAYATSIAENFRDKGLHVLLLMDSLTRYAMAQREIALAIGEPPATKGYPPSCFSKLPKLVERSGNGMNDVGSITAFYTVLAEGDDPQDPIADAARAILDGHIVLSRSLAEAGHYPAISIEQSASRVMHNVVSREHFELARKFKSINACFERGKDLIQIGAYIPGSDASLDEAINLHDKQEMFLQQAMWEPVDFQSSLVEMTAAMS